MPKYGLSDSQWTKAAEEIERILIQVAKEKSVIFYSNLTLRITSVSLEPNSYALHHLLGDISRSEDANGRGMLSVLVVNKSDGQPGPGFFDLAQELGRDINEIVKCQVEESKIVYSAWS